MKVKKLPVTVNAILFNGNYEEVFDFMKLEEWERLEILENPEPNIPIKSLKGIMILTYGNVLIKGVKGEFYPCDYEIFKETYEVIEP